MSDQNASRKRKAPAPVVLDRHKLGAARLWATDPRRFPYLATAIFATTIVPAPGLAEGGGDGVAVDDRWRLYIDPTVVDGWRVDELGALLVHHTGHLVRDHAARARTLGVTDATAERWALAADAELNDDLADAGLVVPGDPVVPEDLGFERGRLAEEYFHRSAEQPEEGDDDEDGEGDQPPAPKKKAPDHGSGSHGQQRPWEDPSPDDGDGGEGSERPPSSGGLDNHEGDLVRAAVANAILDAMRHGQGNVPGNWQRWAQELLAPTVDWRRALAAEVRRGVQAVAGAVDYSYRRPSRRASVSPAIVLPALEKPVPEVAIVCDTSGSMGERELTRVLAEVEGLLSSIGLRNAGVRVLAVDAAVQAVRRVSSARQVELVGGGGTDMAAGIEAAAALRPRPAVLVVLTDGLTPWPAVAPRGMRVVIGLLPSPFSTGGRGPTAPSWARVVRIDDDER
jgi:predicted metal-dependent peptidase